MFIDTKVLETMARQHYMEKFLVMDLHMERDQAFFLAKKLICYKEEIIQLLTEEIEWE